MNQEKLIKYITGNLTNPKEREEIVSWINDSKENKQTFAELKNIHALSRKPQGKTDVELEYLQFQKQLPQQNKTRVLHLLKYAAVFLLAFASSWFIQYNLNNKDIGEVAMNELTAPSGQICELKLSDGTKVWLNSESTISYPANFDKSQRSVHLTGEAFFEVNKQNRPFVVSTQTMHVKVLGTSFNLEAYPENRFVKTVLIEGRVEIQDQDQEKLTEIKPGELALLDIQTHELSTSPVNTQAYSSWKEGVLSFSKEPLETIIPKLERWYNVQFVFKDQAIKKDEFTITVLKQTPIEQILQFLQFSGDITYEVVENPTGKNKIELSKKKSL